MAEEQPVQAVDISPPKKKQWPAEEVVLRPIEKLKPYKNNARTHSEAQIKQIADSMVEWGWTMPVLIDEHDRIIAGHGRVDAAKLLKLDTAPCLVARGWTNAQKRAYVIADNKLAENAGWDEDLLSFEISGLSEADFDLSLLGFTDLELEGFSTEAEETEMPGLPSEDKLPFQQMSFNLYDEQIESVENALEVAAGMGPFESENQSAKGNALARVCELFLQHYGNS